ncbi:15227_t:CDS:2, partial [Funneliformis caledonium]
KNSFSPFENDGVDSVKVDSTEISMYFATANRTAVKSAYSTGSISPEQFDFRTEQTIRIVPICKFTLELCIGK